MTLDTTLNNPYVISERWQQEYTDLTAHIADRRRLRRKLFVALVVVSALLASALFFTYLIDIPSSSQLAVKAFGLVAAVLFRTRDSKLRHEVSEAEVRATVLALRLADDPSRESTLVSRPTGRSWIRLGYNVVLTGWLLALLLDALIVAQVLTVVMRVASTPR